MRIFVLLAILFCSTPSFAASFDCAKASGFVEKEICLDPVLGRLDEALSNNYKGMLSSDFGGSVSSLRDEQRKWIANRNKCTTRDCLISAYRKRVDETCNYGVVSGVHPECMLAEDVEKDLSNSSHSKYRDNEISKKNNARSYSLLNALMAQYGDYRLQTLIQYAQLSGCLFEQQETDFFENKKMGHLRVDEIKFKKGCSLEDVGVLYGVVKVAVMPISTSSPVFSYVYKKDGRSPLLLRLRNEYLDEEMRTFKNNIEAIRKSKN
ncbi:hypothetical protein [Achromobacter sp. Marseille-Q4962]|uniref:lysozyme inhibitor LprI family protein n=1 Tax=Achromobacter sp. Marseille-Q4962 TaxID=2942202 RepID=UPI00207452D5|nr:hypothetical protein [Achromobacter sp. Marseille-Q4962]